jgi:hypothetical protein
MRRIWRRHAMHSRRRVDKVIGNFHDVINCAYRCDCGVGKLCQLAWRRSIIADFYTSPSLGPRALRYRHDSEFSAKNASTVIYWLNLLSLYIYIILFHPKPIGPICLGSSHVVSSVAIMNRLNTPLPVSDYEHLLLLRCRMKASQMRRKSRFNTITRLKFRR